MIDIAKTDTPNMFHNKYSGSSSNSLEKISIQHMDENNMDKRVDKNSLSKEDTKKLVDDLNKMSESLGAIVKFAYNDKIGEVYISVIDKKSGEEILKFPSDEVMKIKENMKDLVGSLLDTKG